MTDAVLAPGDVVHVAARVVETYPGEARVQFSGIGCDHSLVLRTADFVAHERRDDVTVADIAGAGGRTRKVILPRPAPER